MGTVFVAYGGSGRRQAVLEFAADQAAASGYDLVVYHARESTDEPVEEITEEIESVLQESAPGLVFEVQTDSREEISDRTNVSKHKRLTDAVLEADRDYEYAVMGHVQRGSIEEFARASMTKAMLEAHALPVVLVPV